MARLLLLSAILVAAVTVHAQDLVLRVTVHGAKVVERNTESVTVAQPAWQPFAQVEGKTDAYVVLKAGDPARMFSKFATAVTSTQSNTLSPTWMETLTLGPQKQNAILYYAIYDRVGPKDWSHGDRKIPLKDTILAEGKLDIAQMESLFGSSGSINIDTKGGQTLSLYINWSNIYSLCPENSKTNFKRKFFDEIGKNHCVCGRRYALMSPEGECTKMRDNIRTCDKDTKSRERVNPCSSETQRCKDLDLADFHTKCGATEPCDFFECKGN